LAHYKPFTNHGSTFLTNSFRILHIDPPPQWIQDIYATALAESDFELVWVPELDHDMPPEVLRGASALVTNQRRVTRSAIHTTGPSLRLIQVQGRAPWAADLMAAREAGVPVSFMPHRGAIAVAEHTFALMLGLMRKLVAGHHGTAAAGYRELGIEPIRTSERTIAFNWLGFADVGQLYGQTLGLIGLGDIGLEVARRARAFDMNVLYTKRRPLRSEYEEMVGVRHASLHELLRESDVVSVHAPHTPETEGLIDGAALARMKDSAILVNTARGGLVDEEALAECLRDRRIAGAGLDVFLDEPLPEGHVLLALDNVLLSPHLGGGTGGGQKGMVADVVANLERVSRGEPPLQLAIP
jgi:phosphoglycerate dehydrogenase-like enzyme